MAVLVLLFALLIHGYAALRKEHLISVRELSLSMFVARHGPLTASETGMLRPWMTFDYVNRIFGLPPDFLKTAFSIEDPSYPKLTLSGYAAERGFDEKEFLAAVQAAVAHKLSPSE